MAEFCFVFCMAYTCYFLKNSPESFCIHVANRIHDLNILPPVSNAFFALETPDLLAKETRDVFAGFLPYDFAWSK